MTLPPPPPLPILLRWSVENKKKLGAGGVRTGQRKPATDLSTLLYYKSTAAVGNNRRPRSGVVTVFFHSTFFRGETDGRRRVPFPLFSPKKKLPKRLNFFFFLQPNLPDDLFFFDVAKERRERGGRAEIRGQNRKRGPQNPLSWGPAKPTKSGKSCESSSLLTFWFSESVVAPLPKLAREPRSTLSALAPAALPSREAPSSKSLRRRNGT